MSRYGHAWPDDGPKADKLCLKCGARHGDVIEARKHRKANPTGAVDARTYALLECMVEGTVRTEPHARSAPTVPASEKPCQYCGHAEAVHDGNVNKIIKQSYPSVRWTTTACSKAGCACRTFVFGRKASGNLR